MKSCRGWDCSRDLNNDGYLGVKVLERGREWSDWKPSPPLHAPSIKGIFLSMHTAPSPIIITIHWNRLSTKKAILTQLTLFMNLLPSNRSLEAPKRFLQNATHLDHLDFLQLSMRGHSLQTARGGGRGILGELKEGTEGRSVVANRV